MPLHPPIPAACYLDRQCPLGIVQPTLSQQLTVLREEKLVTTRREGKNIYYQIASPQAMAIMAVMYEQFCNNNEGESV